MPWTGTINARDVDASKDFRFSFHQDLSKDVFPFATTPWTPRHEIGLSLGHKHNRNIHPHALALGPEDETAVILRHRQLL